jgi:(p)ppGpp synthase/HD superfamily hydrolase
MWSKKEQKAIEFSFRAHHKQKRRGSEIEYVSHPVIVGIILAKTGAEEAIIIAGILHDVIEDTDFSKKDIEVKFGKEIADLVDEVSEKDRDLPYRERKERAVAKLFFITEQAALIKAADVLSNLVDLCLYLDREGEEAFKIFNTGKNRKIKMTERKIKILEQKVKNKELIANLNERLKEIKKYED